MPATTLVHEVRNPLNVVDLVQRSSTSSPPSCGTVASRTSSIAGATVPLVPCPSGCTSSTGAGREAAGAFLLLVGRHRVVLLRQPPREGGSPGPSPYSSSRSPPSLVLVAVFRFRRTPLAVPTLSKEWWVNVARTAAIDCCSCLSHERNRRSLRRRALPVPPSPPVASSHGPPALGSAENGYTKRGNATCLTLFGVFGVVWCVWLCFGMHAGHSQCVWPQCEDNAK